MKFHLTMRLAALLITAFLGACSSDEDPPLPDNLVSFESSLLSFSEQEDELLVTIALSREAGFSGVVEVSVTSNGLEYGQDFTTQPATQSDRLLIPFGENDRQLSFTISKVPNAVFDGNEEIVFGLLTLPEGLVLGNMTELTVKLDEIISSGAEMIINGGGSGYPNIVFINFRANRQTAVRRDSWDLAFYNGNGFHVSLNFAVPMLARAIDKTDLATVTPADTLGFGAVMVVGPNATPLAAPWVDGMTGDLNENAIAPISPIEGENKVYILELGNPNPPSNPTEPYNSRGMKKIRIIQRNGGYVLQHAAIADDTFEEIIIPKNTSHNFTYVSFSSGIVNVTPPKDRWDMAWTARTNKISFGQGEIPYLFQDVVVSNRNGVAAAMVMKEEIAWENISQSDINTLDFSEGELSIGTQWRGGGGPGRAPAVLDDRYFIVRDTGGNFYKLEFTSLTTDGERGRPSLKYELLQ